MPTILLDENIDGYAEYLSRFIFSPEWTSISSSLGLRIVTFDDVGLTKGTSDESLWDFCQQQRYCLMTDNRNDDKPDSLETVIRTRNSSTSLPVFTISDINRFRSEREYIEALVAKLLEHLIDAGNFHGTGRLFLP